MDLCRKEKVDHEKIGELPELRVIARVDRRERIGLGRYLCAFATLSFPSLRPLAPSGGFEEDIEGLLEKKMW